MLAAIALAALIGVFRATGPTEVASVAGPTGSVGTSGYVSRTLPGRTELQLPASGMEGRLLTHIQTASPFDRETWFEFDRLNFEADTARLRPDSREQLVNTAAILRAYPNVRVKIGGYTDNAGDSVTNLRLSQARADTVAAELRALGVASARLSMEGYGEQYPIADNSTADGRARNRRVAIRVLSK
jgi:OmpA-OmpF porin, OOP family